MKKLALIFVAIVSTSVTSCSKDDDVTNAELQGKWEYSKEGTITNGMEALTDYNHEVGCTKDFIIIDANNYIDHSFETEDCAETTYTAPYTRNGNTITVTESGTTLTGTIMQLDNSTLKIKRTFGLGEGQGIDLVTVFIRR